jgi:hypothetical protein
MEVRAGTRIGYTNLIFFPIKYYIRSQTRMMKSTQNHLFQLTPIDYKRIAFVISCSIFLNGMAFSQTESGKLLKCTWADQYQFNYYKKETVFIRIKPDPDYKPWTKYSYHKLVLEEVQNEVLLLPWARVKMFAYLLLPLIQYS